MAEQLKNLKQLLSEEQHKFVAARAAWDAQRTTMEAHSVRLLRDLQEQTHHQLHEYEAKVSRAEAAVQQALAEARVQVDQIRAKVREHMAQKDVAAKKAMEDMLARWRQERQELLLGAEKLRREMVLEAELERQQVAGDTALIETLELLCLTIAF